MKKLTEYQNEDALDLLADIMEPMVEIMNDQEVTVPAKAGNVLKALTMAMKNHKTAFIAVMAKLEDVPVEEYKCNVLTLPKIAIELLQDKELLAFFRDALQEIGLDVLTDATENSEATETK